MKLIVLDLWLLFGHPVDVPGYSIISVLSTEIFETSKLDPLQYNLRVLAEVQE